MSLIKLKNIKKTYDLGKLKVEALRDVSLEVKSGDFIALMGPSGSGKTTLMNLIGLLDTPTNGSYLLSKEKVDKKSARELARIRNNKIGFVFQLFNLLSRHSALENVMLPLSYNKKKINYKDRKGRAEKVLKEVGLSHRIKHKTNELSGGEQQRIAIARALINNPSIILADEPTGNLDTKKGLEIMEILKILNKSGKTIIMVTHEEEIAEYAKKIIRLKDGLINDKM
ncbi:MAG: ABC transporter ATP-binding protein [Parcubacteria group bacterium]|nr:ABC transporter ATP-binding protein [Parcubacteria group bacterium]